LHFYPRAHGRETEGLHLDVPVAGRQIHRISSVFIGIGDELSFAGLGIGGAGGDHGAGQELVGGADGAGVLGGGQKGREKGQ